MKTFNVFTIQVGQQAKVEKGSKIDSVVIGDSLKMDAVVVGEKGRGRSQGILPVTEVPMVPCPHSGLVPYFTSDACPACGVEYKLSLELGGKRVHPENGEVRGNLLYAGVGKTRSGAAQLETASEATDSDFAILVFRTEIGFRGSNKHSGDRMGWTCDCGQSGDDFIISQCSCGNTPGKGVNYQFHPFPGEIISKGVIAQGDAGGMGSGEQLVTLMPKGKVFRIRLYGRMYGYPEVRYGVFDGQSVKLLTWEERVLADLF
jgi:hypothetical protein